MIASEGLLDPDASKRHSLKGRREEFDHFATEQTERVRQAAEDAITDAKDAVTEATRKLDESVTEAASKAMDAATQAKDSLAHTQRVLGLATDIAGGVAHDASAEEENKRANRLRWGAFCAAVAATGWAMAVGVWVYNDPPEGWELLARPFFGGPVAILLWVATYAQREAREHRTSARLFKHQALAFLALESYADRITRATGDDSRHTYTSADFLKETAAALFTNQIDAHTEQIATQGRTGRSVMRLMRIGTRRDSGSAE